MFKFPCRLSTWWLFFPRNPPTIWFHRTHASSSRRVHIPSCSRRQTPESGSRGGPRYPYLSFFFLKGAVSEIWFPCKDGNTKFTKRYPWKLSRIRYPCFVYLNCFIFIDGFSAKEKTFFPPPQFPFWYFFGPWEFYSVIKI